MGETKRKSVTPPSSCAAGCPPARWSGRRRSRSRRSLLNQDLRSMTTVPSWFDLGEFITEARRARAALASIGATLYCKIDLPVLSNADAELCIAHSHPPGAVSHLLQVKPVVDDQFVKHTLIRELDFSFS